MDNIAEFAKWVPMRLTDDERKLLHILEGALEVSQYTDKVDVSFDYYYSISIHKKHLGLYVAGDQCKPSQKTSLFSNASLRSGSASRLMNPNKMRAPPTAS